MVKSNFLKKTIAFALACSLVAFIGSFFLIKPLTAHAEEVQVQTSYIGNDLWSNAIFLSSVNGGVASSYSQLETGYWPVGQTYRRVDVGFINFKVNLRTDDNGKIIFAPMVYLASGQRWDGSSYYPNTSVLTTVRMDKASFSFSTLNDTTIHSSWYYGTDNDLNYRPYIRFDVQLSSMDFTPNVIKVTMDSLSTVPSQGYIYYYNRIRYYDANNNYCEVKLFANDGHGELVEQGWESRTYYLNNIFNWTDDEAYMQGYNDGQSDGYDNGYNVGYGQGEDFGFNLGKNEGYYNGLNDGRTENLTFLSLLTAVFDAPIQAVFNALDFEILGMNMKNFFYGLLSIAIVVFVIRFITGKKTDE